MAASGPAAIAGQAIGGVRMKRHALEVEASRLSTIASRVGKRLRTWLRSIETHTAPLERTIGRDPETGVDIREQVLDEHGKPIPVPLLPDSEFRENWKLYEKTVTALLSEQRERQKLIHKMGKGQEISDEEFTKQLQLIAREAVLEMPADELDALIEQRARNRAQAARTKQATQEPADIMAGFGDAAD